MARFITDDLTPRIDSAVAEESAEAVAERLRVEMHAAVGSLRERLPEAFPRWQQRRRDASQAAADHSD